MSSDLTADPKQEAAPQEVPKEGFGRMAADWAADQRVFRGVSWGKTMMWVFILGDAFIFACFILGYLAVRQSITEPWPNTAEIFTLHVGGRPIPLLLIIIMTFLLDSSSGTMALAINAAHRRQRRKCAALLFATVALGLTFVGLQATEWTNLIHEGLRPWQNPWGAPQFGSSFFLLTGFHGLHVSMGILFMANIARKVAMGDLDVGRRGFFTGRRGRYEMVEIMGLYWHFVDLVWVFLFALLYLW
jgi:cytochrome c oxidase subunit 3